MVPPAKEAQQNGDDHASDENLIDDEYDRKLADKLATIEELRYDLKSEGIECPGVLVVGAQSAGKSSVLERLTGIAFPRAENTCTKVPTIVQLQTDPGVESPKALVSKTADFRNGSEQCSSMEDIQNAILSFTEELVSEQNPIRDSPIYIRYIRKKGPVMTLIDLPGITHINTSSNPNFDIHEATAAMVRKYVDNENMIILVVIPANDDFGNSEALQIARTFDKEGVRTIGVISKCDLVPDNSDIIQKIRMTRENDVQLKLGFIAVRNKGPNEVDLDIGAAEEELFESHRLLRHLKPEERGYDTLCRKVVHLQSEKVSCFIPEVKQMVHKKISEISEALKGMDSVPNTANECRRVLTAELCGIYEKVSSLIKAEDTSYRPHNIAARSYEFAQEYAEAIRKEVPDCLGDDMTEELKEQIRETRGYALPNFLSETIFRDQISSIFFSGVVENNTYCFVDRTMELIRSVYNDIIKEQNGMKRYPSLAWSVAEKTDDIFREACEQAHTLTKAIIEAEKKQIFTMNSQYTKFLREASHAMYEEVKHRAAEEYRRTNSFSSHTFGAPAFAPPTGFGSSVQTFISAGEDLMASLKEYAKKRVAIDEKDMEEKTISELQISLACYSEIIMSRLFDVIPMVVYCALIYEVREKYMSTIQGMFDDAHLLGFFVEELSVKNRRQRREKSLRVMREAVGKLNKLR